MRKLSRIALFSLAALATVTTVEAGADKVAPAKPDVSAMVRKKLERLTYYGVFDFLNYRIGENGAVELSGFVFRDLLKKEAEDAVLEVEGVTQVVNKIEDLDWGVQDDEIRARVYLTIYRNGVLSRYGTSTDIALANGVGYGPRGRFDVFGPLGIGNPFFPGFNPAGEYGIHILVTNGEVILVGEVDNEADKNLAGIKARGVFPVKKVFNELSVRGARPEVPQAPARPGKGGVVVEAPEF